VIVDSEILNCNKELNLASVDSLLNTFILKSLNQDEELDQKTTNQEKWSDRKTTN